MSRRVFFLGTGSSLGVPVIGCKCSVCRSGDSKNTRLRCSVLLELEGKVFLIDPGPDHRFQALRLGIDHLDGVIVTHAHYDHMGGFGDLKVYSKEGKKLPCLLSGPTFSVIRRQFSHLFTEKGDESPLFSCQILDGLFGKTTFEGVSIEYVSFSQGGMQVTGFKIGDFAYISDIKTYEPELIANLKGVKTLVLSAARRQPSQMHFSFEEAFTFAGTVGAEKTYLTHISHESTHQDLEKLLPQSVSPAYDGLIISL